MPAAHHPVPLDDAVRLAARQGEPDRYLAALLGPAARRDDQIALAAFAGEVRRIPRLVKDPHLAEIRLTWWRDFLLDASGSARSGNPVADAFAAAAVRHSLPRDSLAAYFDAFAHTLYAAGPQDAAHLALEHELIDGALFQFAARINGAEFDDKLTRACADAGLAYGLARLALEFPHALARSRMPLPLAFDAATGGFDKAAALQMLTATARSSMARLKAQWRGWAPGTRAALLPVALVEPYLRACHGQGHDIAYHLGEVAPMTRVWRLWRAAMTRRI